MGQVLKISVLWNYFGASQNVNTAFITIIMCKFYTRLKTKAVKNLRHMSRYNPFIS